MPNHTIPGHYSTTAPPLQYNCLRCTTLDFIALHWRMPTHMHAYILTIHLEHCIAARWILYIHTTSHHIALLISHCMTLQYTHHKPSQDMNKGKENNKITARNRLYKQDTKRYLKQVHTRLTAIQYITLHYIINDEKLYDMTLPFITYIASNCVKLRVHDVYLDCMCTYVHVVWKNVHKYAYTSFEHRTSHFALKDFSQNLAPANNWRNPPCLAPDFLSKGSICAACNRYAHARVQTWEPGYRPGKRKG